MLPCFFSKYIGRSGLEFFYRQYRCYCGRRSESQKGIRWSSICFLYTGFSIAPVLSGIFNSAIMSTMNNDTFKNLILVTFICKFFGFLLCLFIKIEPDNANKDNPKPISTLFTDCMKKLHHIGNLGQLLYMRQPEGRSFTFQFWYNTY